MVLYVVSLITLASIAFAAYHLVRVPLGPACPRCGTLTEPSDDAAHHYFHFTTRFRSEEANCPGCGWNGRLRRAPRPQLVRVTLRERRRA
jgi:hypothetical protein